jgi:hypothetical protein
MGFLKKMNTNGSFAARSLLKHFFRLHGAGKEGLDGGIQAGDVHPGVIRLLGKGVDLLLV